MSSNANRLRASGLTAICIAILAASVTCVNAQAIGTPEARAKDFYTWYLKAIDSNKNSPKNKTVISSYVSKRFSRWYYSKAVQESDIGVFINKHEWSAAWADNIEAGEAYFLTQNRAIVNIKLSTPPDEFVRLQVTLIKEGGKWKIDRVRSLFD